MKPAGFPSLEERDVHVWRVALDGLQEDWRAILQTEEMVRSTRFVSSVHRKRYQAGRGMLRILLSCYLGVPPMDIRLAIRPAGKPFVKAPESDLRFNVSHSHDMALYAFARSGEIGVDIERKRPGVDIEAIARRFFSPREAIFLNARRGQEALDVFYSLWTLKEAYAKGTGEGLAELLQMEVLPDTVLPAPWRLHRIDLADDFAAAVAVQGERSIRLWEWPFTGCTL
jgi:4'-phosphopantetheinyl transferase